MAKCTFCSQDIEPGKGIMFVTAEGKILHFCSGKCRKAHKLGRNKKRLGWIRKRKKKKEEEGK
ncbi:MAG: 50S ribosomal protein L24e [Candidatus Pacearchaeota archaeon]|nr:MAG: 50S ribosomal protein L24e [Candidatus Pacearchaeota archaeon]